MFNLFPYKYIRFFDKLKQTFMHTGNLDYITLCSAYSQIKIVHMNVFYFPQKGSLTFKRSRRPFSLLLVKYRN